MIDYDEIFKNPLLVEVVFEARFPLLLKIPRDIADFQESILEKFPQANIIYDKKFFFDPKEGSEEISEKAWEFKNPKNKTKCQVYKHKFSLFSNEYQSWLSHETKEGFIDILNFSLGKFLKFYDIKDFNRIGLRYINRVELEEKTSDWFKNFFVPIFNIERYKLEELTQNSVRLRVKKENYVELTIMGNFQIENNKIYYILDFDAFSLDVKRDNLQERIKNLHEAILKEFHSLITEECRIKMRGEL